MTWENWAITIATFLPIAGALVIALVPREQETAVRALGIVVTGAALVDRDRDRVRPSTTARRDCSSSSTCEWIPAISARYHVGIDGISLPLLVLTFVLSFLCAIYTWRFVPEPGKTKAFLGLMLLLETGMAGTFIAFDLILFFVFWELVLVPMYFLIGIWGSANREYAAIKFFLYTLFGSIFMLLGFLAMFFNSDVGSGVHTFDIVALQEFAAGGGFSQLVPADRVRRGRARLRRQGADVAVPHVAPRRAYRGADGRLGAAGRGHAEDGHLRVHPDRAADPAGRRRRSTRRGSACSRRSRSSTRRWPASRRRT